MCRRKFRKSLRAHAQGHTRINSHKLACCSIMDNLLLNVCTAVTCENVYLLQRVLYMMLLLMCMLHVCVCDVCVYIHV